MSKPLAITVRLKGDIAEIFRREMEELHESAQCYAQKAMFERYNRDHGAIRLDRNPLVYKREKRTGDSNE